MATSGRWSPNKVRKRLLDDTWVFPNSGMVLMRPTSIVSTGTSASATIGANGSVSFSAVSSLSLNGVFTSAYDNYMVVVRFSASATDDFDFRLRVSGTDNSTASSYTNQYLDANGTSVSGGRASVNYGRFIYNGTVQRAGGILNVFGPNLAQPTAYRSTTVLDSSSAYLYDVAGTHNQSTAYDGLTLLRRGSTATITGLVSVYGLGG